MLGNSTMVKDFYGQLGEDTHGKATYMDWRLDALRNRQSIFVRGWFSPVQLRDLQSLVQITGL